MSTLKTDVLKDVAETVTVNVVDIPNAISLRQDLTSSDPDKGATILNRGTVSLEKIQDLQTIARRSDLRYLVRGFYTSSNIGGGEFYWSPTEPKANHNGWRIIDPTVVWNGTTATLEAYLLATPASGTGCFIRVFDGEALPEMAGAVTDWNGTTGTSAVPSLNALIEDVAVTAIMGSGKPYWFGSLTVNQIRFTITRDIRINWGGSLLVCSSDNTLAGTDAALFRFTDCRLNMSNYVFDDVSFLIGGVSRGAMPVSLLATAATTRGHTLGPFHVIRGQSLLTAGSTNPNTARSVGIRFVGSCTGNTVYYGVNLANNGDDFVGEYSVDKVNRLLFVYGVDGCNAVCHGNEGQPASANILISNSGTGFPQTRNVKCVARMITINGPLSIADQSVADGTGTYENIDVDFSFTTLGGNILASDPIVRIGAFDPGSSYHTTEKTIRTNNVKIALRPGPNVALLDIPIKVYTPSPNYGLLSLIESTPYEVSNLFPKNASNVPMGPTVEVNGRFMKVAHGDLTAAGNTAIIPTKFLAARDKNYEVNAELRVTLRNNVGGSNEYTWKVYNIIGTLSSTGVLTLHKATELQSNINGGLTPVVTVAAVASGLQVSATVYTGANANLVASASWV